MRCLLVLPLLTVACSSSLQRGAAFYGFGAVGLSSAAASGIGAAVAAGSEAPGDAPLILGVAAGASFLIGALCMVAGSGQIEQAEAELRAGLPLERSSRRSRNAPTRSRQSGGEKTKIILDRFRAKPTATSTISMDFCRTLTDSEAKIECMEKALQTEGILPE